MIIKNLSSYHYSMYDTDFLSQSRTKILTKLFDVVTMEQVLYKQKTYKNKEILIYMFLVIFDGINRIVFLMRQKLGLYKMYCSI